MDTAPRPDAPAIWLLALGQTLGYAGLVYIFGALLLPWEEALGWSKTTLALGPTLSILVSAALAPFAGRLVDRGWSAELLTGGAALGAAALAGLALVATPAQYLIAWAVIGVAHCACLYEVCFAFLIRRLGPQARPAIVKVTLLAGFASTIAFPAGTLLAASVGWRGAVLAFALALALVVVPGNWIAGRRLRRGQPPGRRPPGSETAEEARAAFRAARRLPAFWLLAAAFGLVATNHAMLVSFFLPLFAERGASPAMAVAAASTVGPFQVAGRLLLTMSEARLGARRATLVMLASLLLAALVLWLSGLAPGLIFAFAALQGVAVGLMSVLRPVMTAQTLGQRGFGAISGAIAMAPLLGTAAAPFLGALAFEAGGGPALVALALAMAATAALCAAPLLRRPQVGG
jgi:predicted MFS family arabinose efflux permease